MTVSELKAVLEHISGDNDGEIQVLVELKSYVHVIETVRLEWDLHAQPYPTFIIVPDPKV